MEFLLLDNAYWLLYGQKSIVFYNLQEFEQPNYSKLSLRKDARKKQEGHFSVI